MFIFHWMRHCIPQELALSFPNIAKANRQSTGTYSSRLYIGKPTREPSEHYLAITNDTVKHPVTNWGNYVDIQGRNISCDHYYTSLDVANRLLRKKDNYWQKQF